MMLLLLRFPAFVPVISVWNRRLTRRPHDAHTIGICLTGRDPGYGVVVWIEEQVATAGFVPPEVIKVRSSNSSAAPKMERGIASIRRLDERQLAS
jgi:hypothetical protein